MILVGLLSHLASIPTLAIMLVAIATIKSELLATDGLRTMLHGSLTYWTMLLGSLFLIIKGDGNWSVYEKILKNG